MAPPGVLKSKVRVVRAPRRVRVELVRARRPPTGTENRYRAAPAPTRGTPVPAVGHVASTADQRTARCSFTTALSM